MSVKTVSVLWVDAWKFTLPGLGKVSYSEDGVLRISAAPRTPPTNNVADSSMTNTMPEIPPPSAKCRVMDRIEVRDTGTVKGYGAFCCHEPIPKHEFLGFYEGILRENVDGADPTDRGDYLMTLDGGATVLDGYERAQDRSLFSPVHMNHADQAMANCLRLLSDDDDGTALRRCAFFTARDINVGEELCFDYGENYWRGRENEKI